MFSIVYDGEIYIGSNVTTAMAVVRLAAIEHLLDVLEFDPATSDPDRTFAERINDRARFAITPANDDRRRDLDSFGVPEQIGQDNYYGSLDEAYSAYRAAE